MLTQSLVQFITQPVVRSVGDSLKGGGAKQFTPAEQQASLILDFTRNFYGVQSADAANANTLYPLTSLVLDFVNNLYFTEGT